MPTPLIPHHPLTDDDIRLLRSEVSGPVYLPGDPGLAEEAAGFDLAVVRRPVAVVAAGRAQDVVAAVRWAAERRVPVAVQATGHGSVPCDGGLFVSTRSMRGVLVNPERRLARIEAGTRWREVVDAAARHGLAPLSGSSSAVGAVGYTLGGGLGLLGREYGFAADHVTALDLVTADGRLRHVTADAEPELFWAVRGGRDQFGIVTAIEVRLFPVTTLYAGGIYFTASSTASVLHAYRTWAPTLPESASSSVALLRLPPLERLPEPLRGMFVVHLRYSYNGPAEEGEALLAPMRQSGEAVLDHIGRLPVTETDSVCQDPTEPMPLWHQGGLLRSLDADTVEALIAAAGPQADVPPLAVEIRQLGGALSRPASPPNAVAGRDGAYCLHVVGPLLPGLEEALPAAGNGIVDAVKPWSTGGALLNFCSISTPEETAAVWGAEDHARLLAVKRAEDPSGLFRFGPALCDD
ncbi:FAD-binding oxidoreductase [Streptomyces sp. NPDC086080]|uniref:FAD-binding oxidoreductase n=1 Tax=Streptomyces sp. NPDC086080 TaxID=3365748 RepID=UPI0037D40D6A